MRRATRRAGSGSSCGRVACAPSTSSSASAASSCSATDAGSAGRPAERGDARGDGERVGGADRRAQVGRVGEGAGRAARRPARAGGRSARPAPRRPAPPARRRCSPAASSTRWPAERARAQRAGRAGVGERADERRRQQPGALGRGVGVGAQGGATGGGAQGAVRGGDRDDDGPSVARAPGGQLGGAVAQLGLEQRAQPGGAGARSATAAASSGMAPSLGGSVRSGPYGAT